MCGTACVFSAFVASETLASSESSAQRDPDVRLMLEVQAGNAAAFEELVLRYQGRLLTVFAHLAGNRDMADDLAQEVFLRVFRARKTYRPEAKFATWLYTIANNVATNALRSHWRRREVSVMQGGTTGVASLEAMAQASSGQMPTRQIDKAEMRQIVRMALAALNERQRMALLLNKFEDMSYPDIAEAMGLSPQAVKSLLSRARVNLREILAPYLEYGEAPVGEGPADVPSTDS